jgi:class 3 adenylate cyclase
MGSGVSEAMIRDGIAQGALDWVIKPIDPVLLRARLEAWFKLRDAQEKLWALNETLEERFLGRTQELKEINDLFLRFVPRQFQERIFKTRSIDSGIYDSADLTILFLDIRGFTTLAEEKNAGDMVAALSHLFERLLPLISENQGFVDNFSGDSFMAVFEGEHSAENAVAAAIAIQRIMQMPGFSLRVGIGINSGPVVFAAIGSDERMSSTVLGDQVNLCARIEKLTKSFGAQVLISESTYERLPEGMWRDESRFVDHLRVRGRQKPVQIFEVCSGDPDPIREAKTVVRPLFDAALSHYAERHFEEALRGFRECLRIFPQDLVAIEYVRRCRYFLKNSPDQEFFSRGIREGEEFIDPSVRRRFPRYSISADVELEFVHNDLVLVDQRIRIPGRIMDISVQGLMLESIHCPPQGTVFDLRVGFGGTRLEAVLGRQVYRFVCQVRWRAPGNPSRLGVSFIQLSEDEESRLQAALERLTDAPQ